MQSKYLFLFAFLSTTFSSVLVGDQCNQCSQLKSKKDCNDFGCTWTEGSSVLNCIKKGSQTNSAYCSKMEQSKCSKTIGCALLHDVCTTLAGCSAYTKTSIQDCQAISSKCIWEGAYCTDARPCDQYTKELCQSTVDLNGRKCTWESSTEACRNFECYEADATYNTNEACQAFSQDCKTNGSGCLYHCNTCSQSEPSKKCSDQSDCIKDSNGNPCLLVNGICYDYTSCKSVTTANSLSECQAFNPLCVISYSSCVAQQSCENYTSERECVVGINNKKCIWSPSLYRCKTFENCSDAQGIGNGDYITFQQCQNIDKSCISDGQNCIDKGVCSQYKTSIACLNEGTDGKCNWTQSKCRLAVCTDYVFTNAFDCEQQILAKGPCNSDGVTCVERTQCSQYKTKEMCNFDADGKQCIYASGITEEKSCRVKICKDETWTTSEQCKDVVGGRVCVSNGKNCVEQQTCSNYTNKITCNAGGSDGICVFSFDPTYSDPLAGTCKLLTSCEEANNDSVACNKKPACQWQRSNPSSCQTKTCLEAASGSTCNYIPSFDETKFTICALVLGVCTESDPSVLNSDTCYPQSAYSYTWDQSECFNHIGSYYYFKQEYINNCTINVMQRIKINQYA